MSEPTYEEARMQNPTERPFEPVHILARTPNTADTLLHHSCCRGTGCACSACEIVALRSELDRRGEEIERQSKELRADRVEIRDLISQRDEARAERDRAQAELSDGYDAVFGMVPQADDAEGKPLTLAQKINILREEAEAAERALAAANAKLAKLEEVIALPIAGVQVQHGPYQKRRVSMQRADVWHPDAHRYEGWVLTREDIIALLSAPDTEKAKEPERETSHE